MNAKNDERQMPLHVRSLFEERGTQGISLTGASDYEMLKRSGALLRGGSWNFCMPVLP